MDKKIDTETGGMDAQSSDILQHSYKYILLVFAFIASSLNMAARSQQQAADIAARFLNSLPSTSDTVKGTRTHKSTALSLAHTRYILQEDSEAVTPIVAFYVFNQADGGYAIVSAIDGTPDILVYSDKDTFCADRLNPSFAFWLNMLQEELSAVQHQKNYTVRTDSKTTPIAPLLVNDRGEAINWHQLEPYNSLCPTNYLTGEQCATGCVATAAGMVLAKWRYPEQGIGQKTIYWQDIRPSNESSILQNEFVELTADFQNTHYDWNNMLPTYLGVETTLEQKTAVATLLYHLGIASEMVYDIAEAGGSGTYTDYMAAGLEEHFDYRYDKFVSTLSEEEYTCYGTFPSHAHTSEWNVTKDQLADFFNADLEAGRPIIVGGEDKNDGHQFVCDGRDERGYFHFNWGWNGSGNNYCLLTSLIPEGQKTNFSLCIDAIIGLEPKFTPTDITSAPSSSRPATKTLRNGKLLIHHNDKTYNAQGIHVK